MFRGHEAGDVIQAKGSQLHHLDIGQRIGPGPIFVGYNTRPTEQQSR